MIILVFKGSERRAGYMFTNGTMNRKANSWMNDFSLLTGMPN